MHPSDIEQIQQVRMIWYVTRFFFLQKMRQSYLKDGDGFLLVYAINNRASFDAVKPFYEEMLTAKENIEVTSTETFI